MFGRKRQPKDFLQREAAERRQQEDEQPWFLTDDEGPDLDIEAGRSARLATRDALTHARLYKPNS